MSWAQIVRSINSNLSRTLDQQISDRFNQVDARLSTLESQVTNASNTIITSGATSDMVLERVSNWTTVASDNVRDGQDNVHAAIPPLHGEGRHNVFRINFFLPGTYRVKVNLRSAAGPLIFFRSTIPYHTFSNGVPVPLHVFNVSVVEPYAAWLGFAAGQVQSTIIFDISICYDIVEIPHKRLPILTRL